MKALVLLVKQISYACIQLLPVGGGTYELQN